MTKLANESAVNKEIIAEDINLNAYPNPFSHETQIAFQLPEDTMVQLDVFDIYGRKIKTLLNSMLPAGAYVKLLRGLSKGVYFYRLTAGTFQQTKSLIVQ